MPYLEVVQGESYIPNEILLIRKGFSAEGLVSLEDDLIEPNYEENDDIAIEATSGELKLLCQYLHKASTVNPKQRSTTEQLLNDKWVV